MTASLMMSPAAAARVGRLGLVVNLARCVGCEACTVACKAENEVPDPHWRTRIVLVPDWGTAEPRPVKWACMHCEEAPCVAVCPTGATFKRADGIVAIDTDRCIGCRYCMVACPYGARFFDEDRGVPDKCDLCLDRVERDLDPACVVTCVGRTITFGDLDDPDSEVAAAVASGRAQPMHPELGTEPSVYYIVGR